MDELSLWTRLSHKVEEEIVMETMGMIVAVTVAVTMVVEEALVVTASNVASLVILLRNALLVMGVEEIGIVAGMIGMAAAAAAAAVVMEDLIAMVTAMVADEAGMGEVVVGREMIDTAVIALDHMNAPVEVGITVLDDWCSCCRYRESVSSVLTCHVFSRSFPT